MTVKLKNDSKRIFQFGPDKNDVFAPGAVGIFKEATAAVLLRHKGVVDLDHVTVDYDQTKVQDFAKAKEKNTYETKEKPAKKAKKSDAPTDDELAGAMGDEEEPAKAAKK